MYNRNNLFNYLLGSLGKLRRSPLQTFFMGWFFIFLGLLFNRFTVAYLFIPDQSVDSRDVELLILAVQILLIGYGIFILRYRGSVWVERIGQCYGMVISLIIGLFAINFGLGFLGIPDENLPQQIGHPPNFGLLIENIEFVHPFITNSMGLRDDEIPIRKPRDTKRIVVIGDSFTEGSGVTVDKTYLSVIEQAYASRGETVDVISCALAGTGPVKQARLYFKFCHQYEPDMVLWALHPNDVTETIPEDNMPDLDVYDRIRTGIPKIGHSLWPRVVVLIERVVEKEGIPTAVWVQPGDVVVPEVPRTAKPLEVDIEETQLVQSVIEEAKNRSIPRSEIDAWIDRLPQDLVTASEDGLFNGYMLAAGLLNTTYWTESFNMEGGFYAERKTDILFGVMDEAIGRLHSAEIPVGIVLIPSVFQYDSSYGNVWADSGVEIEDWSSEPTVYEQRIGAWADQNDLPYLDLTPHYRELIKAHPDGDWYYPIDGHWTEAGHAEAAQVILPFIDSFNPGIAQSSH